MTPADRIVAVDALATAVGIAGSQSAFERLTGTKQQNVSNWLRKRRPLPAEHVLKVEQRTGVSRHLLRPDIYPVEVPGAADSVDCDRSAVLQERAA